MTRAQRAELERTLAMTMALLLDRWPRLTRIQRSIVAGLLLEATEVVAPEPRAKPLRRVH